MSSISVYGYSLAKVPADEETECRPSTAYGRSKLASEKEVLALAGKMPVVILRPGIVYGEGFEGAYATVFEMLKKGKMPVFGSGENVIPFVHVDDVIEAIIQALEKETKSGSVYNIVGREQKTQREIYAIACGELGVKPPKRSVPAALAKLVAFGEVFVSGVAGKKPKLIPEYVEKLASDRRFETKKAEGELGFRAKVKLDEGIREMARHYGGDRDGAA